LRTHIGSDGNLRERRIVLKPGLFAVALAMLALSGAEAAADAKRVLGVIEYVRLLPEGALVPAKLDTGADMSSLHARGVRVVQRDGRDWAVFDIADAGEQPKHFERTVVRWVTIRSGPGVRERRPVVRMEVCVGDVQREVFVNLVDRSGLNFRMLIGRNFMDGYVMVDPGVEMTRAPMCAKAAGP